MSETFAVIFRGEILDGADVATTREKIGNVFKADASKLEKLFSGSNIVVRKGIDQATAEKLVNMFAKMGAKAYAKDIATPEAPTPSSNNPTTQSTAATASSTAASAAPADDGAPKTYPSDVKINPASEAAAKEAPQTVVNLAPSDTSGLSMSDAGELLTEPNAADATPIPDAIQADLVELGEFLAEPVVSNEPAPDVPNEWATLDQ